MSKLYETLEGMKDEIEVQLHFNECWDETIYITQNELEEWHSYIVEMLTDDSKSILERMQKLIDNITAE